MPRLKEPDPIAARVGERIQAFRLEHGFSLGDVHARGGPQKGHLCSIEQGLVRITILTLVQTAQAIGVHPIDLLIDPKASPRQALIERTRLMSEDALGLMLRDAERRIGGRRR